MAGHRPERQNAVGEQEQAGAFRNGTPLGEASRSERQIPDPRGVVIAGGDDTETIGAERNGLPVAASQTRAVLSWLAVTTRVPSGLNAALSTES